MSHLVRALAHPDNADVLLIVLGVFAFAILLGAVLS